MAAVICAVVGFGGFAIGCLTGYAISRDKHHAEIVQLRALLHNLKLARHNLADAEQADPSFSQHKKQ